MRDKLQIIEGFQNIRETLYDIKDEADRYDEANGGYNGDYLVQALSWYIGSGRSSWQFDDALSKCDIKKLVKQCAPKSASNDSAIKAVKSFLKRNCGYSEG